MPTALQVRVAPRITLDVRVHVPKCVSRGVVVIGHRT